MTRRILLCTIGATPQVVTETVWALKNAHDPPWFPDEIHIVTTTFALHDIRRELQAPSGHLAALFDGQAPPVNIHIPCRDGQPVTIGPWQPGEDGDIAKPSTDALADVNTEGDATHMGALIFRLVASFTHDEGTELHVSLAGGRKTMSAHALLAMSLVGRLQDEVSHVLVSPPFEDNRTFWYPGQSEPVLVRVPKPGEEPPFAIEPRGSEQADVTLVPTVVPLLRHEVKDAKDLETLDLVEVVNLRNLALRLQRSPEIVIDTHTNCIIAGGIRRQLNPKSFAIYRLLATARREGWRGVGPDGEGDEYHGWLTIPRITQGRTANREAIQLVHLRQLQQAVTVAGGETRLIDPLTGKAHPNLHESIREWQSNVVIETDLRRKLANAQTSIGSCTRLIEELQANFGGAATAIIGPTVTTRRQKRDDRVLTDGTVNPIGWTRFGLKLQPDCIRII